MLIECKIFRNRPALVPWNGREYFFMPTRDGRSVCDIDDPDLARRLLASGHYVRATDAAPPLMRLPVDAPAESKALLPEGAPVNVDEMTREQMFEYARNLGLRSPHPKISDDKLRLNIKLALAERLADDDLPEDESEDESGDEDGED